MVSMPKQKQYTVKKGIGRRISNHSFFARPREHCNSENMGTPHMQKLLVNKSKFRKNLLSPSAPPTWQRSRCQCLYQRSPNWYMGKSNGVIYSPRIDHGSRAPWKIATTDPVLIRQARANTSRNLIIQSAAYDIVNRFTVIPAQAKKIKISNEIPKLSRMNPTSHPDYISPSNYVYPRGLHPLIRNSIRWRK